MDQRLAVEMDEEGVRVHVIERMSPDWEQSFRWDEVAKVCFKDMGIYDSDVLIIHLRDKAQPVAILTEARGGNDLFGALCDRGLFPPHVMRAAIRETNGGMHCWP
ncbi:hypothetical protein KK141_02430 [Dyella sp. LX-66]|uniref:hypothetical protein n=1 Tax=unclassified Dyella TaxID=2634549 RepID=UPI001BDFED4B|nr:MULTISPECIES: hypothetical protein [unclassified Dyella]MBT2117324.1 hypothetical protein [Dyella sp. LX-1]MBT2138388.1 hypothetical protein [Dyella sp. LX-66]